MDPTFSGDGYQEVSAGYGECHAMTRQQDGKIILVGEKKTIGSEDFLVARCHADGTLDSSFNTTGVVQSQIIGKDAAYSTTVQADGKILVAGYANGATSSVVIRYLADGKLDLSFSTDGIYQESLGGLSAFMAVVVTADGRILLGGASGTLAGRDTTLVRLNSAGSPDVSFDIDGSVTTNINPAGSDYMSAIALQPDGKIVTVGKSGNVSSNVYISRYHLFQKTDLLVGTTISGMVGGNLYSVNGFDQASNLLLKQGGKKQKAFINIQNDGHEIDSFAIKGTKGNKFFIVNYFEGRKNISKANATGTYKTGQLTPGSTLTLNIEITALKKSKGKKCNLVIMATSQVDMLSMDAASSTRRLNNCVDFLIQFSNHEKVTFGRYDHELCQCDGAASCK